MAQEPVASSPAWVNTATPLPTQRDETLVMKEKEETNNSTLTEKAKKLTRKSVIHLQIDGGGEQCVCVGVYFTCNHKCIFVIILSEDFFNRFSQLI